MAVAITQYPTYPVPGRPVRIRFEAAVGNYVRLYMTAAPLKSSWYSKIQNAAALRVLAHQGDERLPWDFTPDVSGKFVFAAQDVSKGASADGGRYLSDPRGYNTEVINGAETTIMITVGSQIDMPCGAGKDTAKIRLWIFGDTCRETTVEAHGEATPAIVKAKTARMENAARSTAVQTALTNLIGRTSATLVGTTGVDTIVNDAITKINAHLTDAGLLYHAVTDADNQTSIGWQSVNNPERMQRAVTELLTNLDAHMRNDSGAGTGSGGYHVNGAGGKITDWSDAVLWTAVGSQAECVIGIVDAFRAYEKHCTMFNAAPAGENVHKAADAVNVLTALTANSIFLLHFQILTELAKTDPSATAPATANPGAQRLAAELGAIET